MPPWRSEHTLRQCSGQPRSTNRAVAPGYVAPKDPEKKRQPCPHGTPCGADGCPGTTLHVDRYPGGIFDVTLWADDYVCSEECSAGSAWQCGILVPDVPWGYYEDTPDGRRPLHVYPGTRHPNFPEFEHDDEDDGDE